MSIVLQFFPNGEFSHGVDTSRQRRDAERKNERIHERRDGVSISALTAEYADIVHKYGISDFERIGQVYLNRRGDEGIVVASNTSGVTFVWLRDGSRLQEYTTKYSLYDMIRNGSLIPLVYQTVENCDNPQNRKKLEGMTKSMARNIRQACYLLDTTGGGKDTLSFLTLTLPSLTQEHLAMVCAEWDNIVKRFMDWLRVTIERKGIKHQYVYCTEIQTERLRLRHEYAPHLHIIFRGRNDKKKPWAITPKQARKAWRRCVAAIVGGEYDFSASENLQRVRKSAGRYMSKYLSKGNACIPIEAASHTIQALRTQWGGMARCLSQSIRKHTRRFSSQFPIPGMAVRIVRCLDKAVQDGIIKFYKKGYIPLGYDSADGSEYGIHVGRGSLQAPTNEDGLSALLRYVESLHQRGEY